MHLQPETLRERNVDLFTSAMRHAAAGDADQLQMMGLAKRDIPYLRQLNIAQLVDLSDRGLDLPSYLRSITCRSDDKALCAALIQHGAPRELILQLFGIGTRRYSAERLRLGVAGRRGRPATNSVSKAVEHRIWRLWVLFANPQDPARLRRADHWLLIGLEVPNQLRLAWALTQRWTQSQGDRTALAGDQIRLTPSQRLEMEQALCKKHSFREDPRQSAGRP